MEYHKITGTGQDTNYATTAIATDFESGKALTTYQLTGCNANSSFLLRFDLNNIYTITE